MSTRTKSVASLQVPKYCSSSLRSPIQDGPGSSREPPPRTTKSSQTNCPPISTAARLSSVMNSCRYQCRLKSRRHNFANCLAHARSSSSAGLCELVFPKGPKSDVGCPLVWLSTKHVGERRLNCFSNHFRVRNETVQIKDTSILSIGAPNCVIVCS